MVDHRRDHALEAEKNSELDSDEYNGEDDPDDRGNQSNPVMKQIAGCKRQDKSHRVMQRIRILRNSWNRMTFDDSSMSMRRHSAAVR
jgi:hypothetical protein